MPITSTNPIVVDGIEYPYYAVSLAVSPLVQETHVGASVSMRLTPYTTDQDGKINTLQGHDRPVVYLDVFESGDVVATTAAYSILDSIQQYINQKGL